MVPQATDFRCERTRRKQYAPPRRGIKRAGLIGIATAVGSTGEFSRHNHSSSHMVLHVTCMWYHIVFKSYAIILDGVPDVSEKIATFLKNPIKGEISRGKYPCSLWYSFHIVEKISSLRHSIAEKKQAEDITKKWKWCRRFHN